jgi:hypothetical protein
MCGGQFVRVHRRFADRLLSLFNPVQRYRCTNHLCRHEAILRMNPPLGQRPIVAAAGLAGAALAGLTFMGFGLYVADESTRAAVRGAYTSFVQRNVASRHDPTLALPEAAAIDESPGPQYEAAAILGAKAETDAPTVDFMPPLPNLAPATSPRAAEPNEVGPPQE